jgi:hypothetical protein
VLSFSLDRMPDWTSAVAEAAGDSVRDTEAGAAYRRRGAARLTCNANSAIGFVSPAHW